MRILLVEDEKRMAQALCEILRLEKYEVDHCGNGLDGLAAVESGIYGQPIRSGRKVSTVGRPSAKIEPIKAKSRSLYPLTRFPAASISRM